MLSSDNLTNPSLLMLECGTALVAVALSFAWPGLGSGFFVRVERLFTGFARRRPLAILTVGLSVPLLRLAMIPLLGIPLPFVPDDFSFLLSADTFAHGRLTNPPPAMWTHFETIHETMVPTYQSMYFPGQGLVLAAGQVLFGHPWYALLAVTALMCAALVWMLQAWLPASWALLGGFIAVIRLGLFSVWIDTYHTAGSLAALGGLLVLGALPRLMRTARLRYGLLMGIGIAILEVTRPYEGLLLCLPVAVVLGRWVYKGTNRPSALVLARRAVLPMGIVLVAGAWLGYYDLKAFGSATTLPYTLNHATYGAPPYYVWQTPSPAPHYRQESIQAYYQKGDLRWYRMDHSLQGFLPYTAMKICFAILFYAGFVFLLPVAVGRQAFLDRRLRFLVLCLMVMMAGLSIEVFLLPYYMAPFVGAIYAVGMQALRHLRLWMPEGKPVGLALVRLTVISCVALAGLRAFAKPLHMSPPDGEMIFSWFGPPHAGEKRAAVEHRLEQLPGGQLAIVRYAPDHPPVDQWIYNAAGIDASKVIWAADMGPAGNQKLIDYYRNRTVWLVEPDAIPARLTPYPEPRTLAAK